MPVLCWIIEGNTQRPANLEQAVTILMNRAQIAQCVFFRIQEKSNEENTVGHHGCLPGPSHHGQRWSI
jgi:hypothetical protein